MPEVKFSQAGEALQMPGNMRPFYLAPGQVTDDSELAMCLLSALSEMDRFDFAPIAHNYKTWYESNPFDMEHTTASGFSGIKTNQKGEVDVAHAYDGVMTYNKDSESNGSLMRHTPMAVYTHLLDS